jgi:hypothetical protein
MAAIKMATAVLRYGEASRKRRVRSGVAECEEDHTRDL